MNREKTQRIKDTPAKCATAWDEQGNPIKGVVISHSPDREMIVEPNRRIHMQQSEVKTFVFYDGPKVPEGQVVVL